MSLRQILGWSDGELMRSDAKPCTRLMRHTAGVFSVGGGLAFWVLCKLHYDPTTSKLCNGAAFSSTPVKTSTNKAFTANKISGFLTFKEGWSGMHQLWLHKQN